LAVAHAHPTTAVHAQHEDGFVRLYDIWDERKCPPLTIEPIFGTSLTYTRASTDSRQHGMVEVGTTRRVQRLLASNVSVLDGALNGTAYLVFAGY
jgi:hypothetical protein